MEPIRCILTPSDVPAVMAVHMLAVPVLPSEVPLRRLAAARPGHELQHSTAQSAGTQYKNNLKQSTFRFRMHDLSSSTWSLHVRSLNGLLHVHLSRRQTNITMVETLGGSKQPVYDPFPYRLPVSSVQYLNIGSHVKVVVVRNVC